MAGPGRKLKERAEETGGRLATLVADLLDLDEGRIAAMDAARIDVQALSLTSPGVEQLPVEEAKIFARATNATIGEAVRRHPGRFFGLASLPLLDPPAALAELDRALAEDGCKGVVINGHCGGRYLDDRIFWPVLARAEALTLPIYLHPTQSPQGVRDAWYGGLKPMVSEMMAGGGWGWHIETALHVASHGARRRVRHASRLADRHRPHGRVAAVHDRARRHDAAADDRAEEADQRLSARERPLHVRRLQLHADLSPVAA